MRLTQQSVYPPLQRIGRKAAAKQDLKGAKRKATDGGGRAIWLATAACSPARRRRAVRDDMRAARRGASGARVLAVRTQAGGRKDGRI